MQIMRYNDAAAYAAHEDTIRAHEVIPAQVMGCPFDSAWGYLPGPGKLAPHTHPADEIYMIFKGEGIVTVDGEQEKVAPGDIVVIPGGADHCIENAGEGELLWCAFWWQPVQA